MLRITLSALVASLVAFTLTANSPVSTEVQVAECNASDPTCDNRGVEGGNVRPCDVSDPACNGRSVPVLIASCNAGDPTCGRRVEGGVARPCDGSDPTCGRSLAAKV